VVSILILLASEDSRKGSESVSAAAGIGVQCNKTGADKEKPTGRYFATLSTRNAILPE